MDYKEEIKNEVVGIEAIKEQIKAWEAKRETAIENINFWKDQLDMEYFKTAPTCEHRTNQICKKKMDDTSIFDFDYCSMYECPIIRNK